MIEGRNLQYYPTPAWLVEKAWSLFQNRRFERVLDACAGTGAMADGLPTLQNWDGRRDARPTVDCIELDVRHHPTLREKGHRVVGLDFLEFQCGTIYSHVIANPPFQQGASHVLKAWDSLWTGEIVAIINAETLHNQCSVERRRLASLIAEHGSAEVVSGAFKGEGVEREAQVDIALVYLQKPAECAEDWIGQVIDGLSMEKPVEGDFKMPTELALPNSFVETQCRAFRAAVKASREAIRAQAVASVFVHRIGKTMASMANEKQDEHSSERVMTGEDVRSVMEAKFDELRDRAWASVLRSTDVLKHLSQKVQKQAESQFATIKCLEFNESNVYGFLLGLVESKPSMQIDMMCDVFDQISRYCTDNSHFFRGWRSNDKHRTCGRKIKRSRFIIPGNSVESYSRSARWETIQMLADFDKTFAILAGTSRPPVSLTDVFEKHFDDLKAGKRVKSSYFDVRLFKGIGTIHFYSNDPSLIDRLNRWVGQHRRWVPPPEQQGVETFWKQYDLAEAMDRDVRKAVKAEQRKSGGYISRWDDPLRSAFSDDREGQPKNERLVLTAIESVLKERGLLDALEAEEARAALGDAPAPEPVQLLLAT